MESVTVWVAGVTAVLSIAAMLAIAFAWRASARRTAGEIAELRARLDGLDASRFARHSTNEQQVAEFLITDVGADHNAPGEVPSRLLLSATVGEPMVRIVALAYGIRRALTPENRNRIRFEMRRELRRARKARRAAGRAAAAEARSQAVGL